MIETRKDGAIAWLLFDRPEKLNAMTIESWAEMGEKLAALGQDPEIRCLILAGEGRAFLAGHDVQEMKDHARREASVIIREAEVQADRIIGASRAAEGSLQSEIIALKRTRRQLAEGLRSTVEMYQRLLDQDLKADAGDESAKS